MDYSPCNYDPAEELTTFLLEVKQLDLNILKAEAQLDNITKNWSSTQTVITNDADILLEEMTQLISILPLAKKLISAISTKLHACGLLEDVKVIFVEKNLNNDDTEKSLEPASNDSEQNYGDCENDPLDFDLDLLDESVKNNPAENVVLKPTIKLYDDYSQNDSSDLKRNCKNRHLNPSLSLKGKNKRETTSKRSSSLSLSSKTPSKKRQTLNNEEIQKKELRIILNRLSDAELRKWNIDISSTTVSRPKRSETSKLWIKYKLRKKTSKSGVVTKKSTSQSNSSLRESSNKPELNSKLNDTDYNPQSSDSEAESDSNDPSSDKVQEKKAPPNKRIWKLNVGAAGAGQKRRYSKYPIYSSCVTRINSSTGKTEYPCQEKHCWKVLSNIRTLIRHIKRKHTPASESVEKVDPIPFKCTICEKPFKHKTDASYHVQTHSATKDFHCTKCSESFQTKKQLQNHILKVHLKKFYYCCHICPLRFPSAEAVRTHKLQEHFDILPEHLKNGNSNIHKTSSNDDNAGDSLIIRKFTCRFCPLSCTKRGSLTVHMKFWHPMEKPYQCDQCLEGFNDLKSSQVHEKSHTSSNGSTGESLIIRNFTCRFCSKCFTKRGSLTVHMKLLHPTEKPYQCDIAQCLEGFNRSNSLQVHEQRHHTQQEFLCELCPKRFSTKQSLACHKKYNHYSTKRFSCPKCDKSFIAKCNMLSHLKFFHEKQRPYLCHLCPRTFADKTPLEYHLQLHKEQPNILIPNRRSIKVKPVKSNASNSDIKCSYDQCGAYFSTKSNLKKHVQAVHEKLRPIKCHLCSRSFYHGKSQLAFHLKSHENQKKRKATKTAGRRNKNYCESDDDFQSGDSVDIKNIITPTRQQPKSLTERTDNYVPLPNVSVPILIESGSSYLHPPIHQIINNNENAIIDMSFEAQSTRPGSWFVPVLK